MNKKITLNLTNNEVCDLRLAVTSIIIDLKRELRDENISEDREKILNRSIKKWQRLHSLIVEQQEKAIMLWENNN